MAGAGAKLFLGARRGDRLQALAAELGGEVAWQELDVTDAASSDAFADTVETRFGASALWSTMPA